jgi:hypothetical protein
MPSLIPSKRILIDTKLSPDKIAELLSKEVAEPPASLFAQMPITGKWWMGNISSDRFQILRITYMRTTLLPRIYGSMFPQGSGTRVDIKIALDPLIIMLSILLYIAFLLGFFLCLGLSIFGYTNIFYSFFAIAFVLYYSLVFLSYRSEAKTAEEFMMGFFKRHEAL